MMPHERSLVNRLRNEPFALLGIDVDRDPNQAKALDAKLHNNWRSWSDPRLQIASRWEVDMLPTIYIVDQRGVIRFQHTGLVEAKVLDRTIDDLLKPAKE